MLPQSPMLEDGRLVCSIELTNACNFRCPICPQAYRYGREPQPAGAPYDRPIGLMREDVFARVLDECSRVARIIELNFFGEQTLHPRYFDYVRALASVPGLEVVTNTNLSLVTREHMQLWIDAELAQVRFSLDAIHDEAFDIARPGKLRDLSGRRDPGRSRMEQTNEKVRHWLAWPDHRPTRLVFVESQHNQGEREAFIDYWQPRLGERDEILVKPVLSYGGKIADPSIHSGACNIWDIKMLQVDWSGNVSPCNLDTNMDLAIGNIMQESLYDIYYGARADALRGQTGCGRSPRPCRTCTDSNFWSNNQYFRKR